MHPDILLKNSALWGIPAAYVLGAFATSIEDVYINGFEDGIYVGMSGPTSAGGTIAPAFDDILFNVNGGNNVTNLIHISNGQSANSTCPPQDANGDMTVNNVCDITIMAATSSTGNTILDDQNGTTLSNSTDPTVGMYVLGEQVVAGGSGIGNSRFTTSPSVPAWIVGSSPASPTMPCSVRSLN